MRCRFVLAKLTDHRDLSLRYFSDYMRVSFGIKNAGSWCNYYNPWGEAWWKQCLFKDQIILN